MSISGHLWDVGFPPSHVSEFSPRPRQHIASCTYVDEDARILWGRGGEIGGRGVWRAGCGGADREWPPRVRPRGSGGPALAPTGVASVSENGAGSW